MAGYAHYLGRRKAGITMRVIDVCRRLWKLRSLIPKSEKVLVNDRLLSEILNTEASANCEDYLPKTILGREIAIQAFGRF